MKGSHIMPMTDKELENLEQILESGDLQQQREAVLAQLKKLDPKELEASGKAHWVEVLERIVRQGSTATPELQNAKNQVVKNRTPKNRLEPTHLKAEAEMLSQQAKNLQVEILETMLKVLVVQLRISNEAEKGQLRERLINGRGIGDGNLTQEEFDKLRSIIRPRLVPQYQFRDPDQVGQLGKQTSSAAALHTTRWQIELEQRLAYVLAMMPREQTLLLLTPEYYEVWKAFEDRIGAQMLTGQDQLVAQMAILDARQNVAQQKYNQKPVSLGDLLKVFERAVKDVLEYAYKPVAGIADLVKRTKNTPFKKEPEPRGRG
jgi:hypothetical protein